MDNEAKIIKLSGQPKKVNKKEKRIWYLFTQFIKDKWKLGNEYLSARVLKEKAEAFEKITQSLKTIQEAKEIAQRIDQKDNKIDVNKLTNKEDLINNLLQEIGDDIKQLAATRGAIINVEVEEEKVIEIDSTSKEKEK